MSTMNELSTILDQMIAAGNTLVSAATALKDFYSSTEDEVPKSPAPAKADPPATDTPGKTYSYEEVRKICAGKSAENDGAHKREVLEIVKKYADGKTLSKVDPSQYAALVAEVEVIGNAG